MPTEHGGTAGGRTCACAEPGAQSKDTSEADPGQGLGMALSLRARVTEAPGDTFGIGAACAVTVWGGGRGALGEL